MDTVTLACTICFSVDSNETVWDWQWGNPSSVTCLFSNAYFPPASRLRFYVLECLGRLAWTVALGSRIAPGCARLPD